jgi:hypothetical protein
MTSSVQMVVAANCLFTASPFAVSGGRAEVASKRQVPPQGAGPVAVLEGFVRYGDALAPWHGSYGNVPELFG